MGFKTNRGYVDMEKTESKQRILIIAGMHRSGTSALARSCNLAGSDLGPDILLPQDDNPTGFWEHRGVVELHDSLFEHLGASWDDTSPLPRKWWEGKTITPYREKLKAILLGDFDGSALPSVKDPRICRLLPLWAATLEEISWAPLFILQTRNPTEVALSLQLRNGFTPSKSYLLWLRHTVEAEIWTRDYQRTFISHSQLLKEKSSLIEKCWDQFGLFWPAGRAQTKKEIDHFIQPGLKHHEATRESLEEDPRIASLVGRAYRGWIHLSEGDKDEGQPIFDCINRILESVDYLFNPPLAKMENRAIAAEQANHEITNEMSEFKAQHSANRALMQELRSEINRLREEKLENVAHWGACRENAGRLEKELETSQRTVGGLNENLDRLKRQHGDLKADLEVRKQRVEELTQNLKELNITVKEFQGQTRDLVAEIRRYREKTNDQDDTIEKLQASELRRCEQISELEVTVENLLHSTSWRLTAPLRAIARALTYSKG